MPNSVRDTYISKPEKKLGKLNLLHDNFSKLSLCSNSDYETCSDGLSPHMKLIRMKNSGSEKDFEKLRILCNGSQLQFSSSLHEYSRIKKPFDSKVIHSVQSDSNVEAKSAFIAAYMKNLLHQNSIDFNNSKTSLRPWNSADNFNYRRYSSVSVTKATESISSKGVNSSLILSVSNTSIKSPDIDEIEETENAHMKSAVSLHGRKQENNVSDREVTETQQYLQEYFISDEIGAIDLSKTGRFRDVSKINEQEKKTLENHETRHENLKIDSINSQILNKCNDSLLNESESYGELIPKVENCRENNINEENVTKSKVTKEISDRGHKSNKSLPATPSFVKTGKDISRERFINTPIEDTLPILSNTSKQKHEKEVSQHYIGSVKQNSMPNSEKVPDTSFKTIPNFEDEKKVDPQYTIDTVTKPISPLVPELELESVQRTEEDRSGSIVNTSPLDMTFSVMASSETFPLRSDASFRSYINKDFSASTGDEKIPERVAPCQNFLHSRNFSPILRIEDELRPFQAKLCELHGRIRALNLDLHMKRGMRTGCTIHASDRPAMLEGINRWLIKLPQNIFMCNYDPQTVLNKSDHSRKQIVNIINKNLPCPIHIKSSIESNMHTNSMQTADSKPLCNKCSHCMKCHMMTKEPKNYKSPNVSQKSSEKRIKHHCKHHCKHTKKDKSKSNIVEETKKSEEPSTIQSEQKLLQMPVAEECRKYMSLNDSNKEIHSIQDFIINEEKTHVEQITKQTDDNVLIPTLDESKDTITKNRSFDDVSSEATHQTYWHLSKSDLPENRASYIELFKLAKKYAFLSRDSSDPSSQIKEEDCNGKIEMKDCKSYFETICPLGTFKNVLSAKQDAPGIRCNPEDFL